MSIGPEPGIEQSAVYAETLPDQGSGGRASPIGDAALAGLAAYFWHRWSKEQKRQMLDDVAHGDFQHGDFQSAELIQRSVRNRGLLVGFGIGYLAGWPAFLLMCALYMVVQIGMQHIGVATYGVLSVPALIITLLLAIIPGVLWRRHALAKDNKRLRDAYDFYLTNQRNRFGTPVRPSLVSPGNYGRPYAPDETHKPGEPTNNQAWDDFIDSAEKRMRGNLGLPPKGR